MPSSPWATRRAIAAWVVVTLVGQFQAFANPYRLSSDDAIAYLDIADAYAHHRWSEAINAYWSPLYSWLIGIAMTVLDPAPQWEFHLLALTNFVVYLLAFAAFQFFLRRLIGFHARRSTVPLPEWVWWSVGLTLFLTSSLYWITVRLDTPDMATSGLVYLASGILLGGDQESLSLPRMAGLGAALAFAYFSKTAMFPVALVFLGVAAIKGGGTRKMAQRALVGCGVFAILVAPFIMAISLDKGRATIGDSGRLNYAWIVNPGNYQIPDQHWIGEAGSPFGFPRHASRQIWSQPATFEFAEPVAGTYPPWADPSYWFEGLSLRFNLSRQMAVIRTNLTYYFDMFGIPVLALLVLTTVGGGLGAFSGWKDVWLLLLPAVTGLGLYMLGTDLRKTSFEGQISTRYVAALAVVVLASIVASVRLRSGIPARVVSTTLGIGALLLGVWVLRDAVSTDLIAMARQPEDRVQLDVAAAMSQLGIAAGDPVAFVGYKRNHMYWARIARVKLIAQTPDERDFFAAAPAVQAAVIDALAATGAKLLLWRNPSDLEVPAGWQPIGDTGYMSYPLRALPSFRPRH